MTPIGAEIEPHRVRLDEVHKWYGRTHAVNGASLTCRQGEVHTLLGENGSGKSTLVKILSGVVGPDSGEVWIGGGRIDRFSPSRAKRARVATVYQEVLVAGNRSVATNVLLGHDRWTRWAQSRDERHERVAEVLTRLSGARIDPRLPVERLSLMRQHQVTVARALVGDPDVLILDESTASLDLESRDRLFEVIGELTRHDKTVIFISHRLDEVLEISDSVTVLRSGEVVDTLRRDDLDSSRLLTLMAGAPTATAAT